MSKPQYQGLFEGCVLYADLKGDAKDCINQYSETVSGATLTTNKFEISDSAYLFNGSSDYIDYETILDTVPSAFTINIWFSPTTTYDSGAASNQELLGKQNILNQDWFELRLENDDGKLSINIEENNGGVVEIQSTQSSWTGGQWYMATMVWSSTNGLLLYVDGVLVASNSGQTTLLRNGTNTNFSLGYKAWTSGFYFNGKLTLPLILEREWSAEEVLAFYNISNKKIPYPYMRRTCQK